MLPLYLYVLVPLAFVAWFIHSYWFHPLSKYPGPFWASQTDLWRVYHLWTRRLPDTLVRLHENYGPVLRIGPNELSFQSVEAINPIYKSGRKVVKSNFYDGFTTFHPNLFGTRNEELHAKRRRQMAHSFSVASLSQMESIFDNHIHELLLTIDGLQGKPFDLKELVAFYTYDVMGTLIFNAEFGSQKAQDSNQLPPINDHIFLGCLYGMLPSLLPYSMQVGKHIPWPWLQNLLKSRETLRNKTSNHVATELARDKTVKRQNILTRLIEARDTETGEGLTGDQIKSEAFGFLVAGSHTTSGTLTLLFYHLLHNPAAAKKLSEELVAGLSLPLADADAQNMALPAFSGLEMQLPYTTACIRENFRISPVFTMPLPRKVCDPEGLVIDGIHVPYGTDVSTVNQVLHHDASVWGDDHDLFRPDRWLEPSKPLSPNNLNPFGAGHRQCIGRNIATMSVLKTVAAVWRRYELVPVDPQEKLVVESVGIGEKKGPLIVRAKVRAE